MSSLFNLLSIFKNLYQQVKPLKIIARYIHLGYRTYTLTSDDIGTIPHTQHEEQRSNTSISWKVKDFITSPMVARIGVIASGALMMLFPPTFAIGVAALGISVAGVALSIAMSGYKCKKIKDIHKENNLIKELLEVEQQKEKVLEKHPGLEQKLAGEMLKYKNFADYQAQTQQAKRANSSIKGILLNTIESNISLLVSILTLNPASYVITSLSTIVTWGESAQAQYEYDTEYSRADNSIEQIKKNLNLGYKKGEGIEILQDLTSVRKAEIKALKSIDGLDIKSNDHVISTFRSKKFEQLQNTNKDIQSSSMNTVKDYLSCTKEALLASVSSKKTQNIFAPPSEHHSLNTKKFQEIKAHEEKVSPKIVIQAQSKIQRRESRKWRDKTKDKKPSQEHSL